MALSDLARRIMGINMANFGAAKEIGDAVDASAKTNADNTHSGTQTFVDTKHRRVFGGQGTALAANGSDFALSGGFGSTASVAVATGSTDRRGRATITSAGTGQGASPTATLTFKDGTFTSVPFGVVCRGGGSQRTVPLDVSFTATTMVITLLGTPVAAETYIICWDVEG